MDRDLLLKSKKRIDKPPFAFWGFLFSTATLLFGLYVYFNQGHISVLFTNPHLDFLTENIISIGAIVSGAIKLIGVFTNIRWLKQGGIILMSGFWTGFATLATIYAWEAGYPSPNFIIYWTVAVACYRISRKGDFY